MSSNFVQGPAPTFFKRERKRRWENPDILGQGEKEKRESRSGGAPKQPPKTKHKTSRQGCQQERYVRPKESRKEKCVRF